MEEKWLDEKLELDRFASQMKEIFPDVSISFREIWNLILEGRLADAAEAVFKGTLQGFDARIEGMKELVILILMIGILSALCSVLMQTFQNRQIADVAHFIAYLMMLSVVTAVFLESAEVAQQMLDRLIRFVRLLVPTFMLALGLATGSMTAVGYYQIILLVLYLVQSVIVRIGIPAAKIFLVLHVMNGIWDEDRLSGIIELLKKGMSGTMKVFLTAIAGISVMQSMVTPVLERLRFEAAGKMLSAIPGLGSLAEGTAGLLLGSAVLMKNGLGTIAVMLTAVICIYPFLHIFLLAGILKLCAGLIGLAADKRIAVCVDGAGDALFLILRIMFTVTGCFVVIFAIITCLAGTAH